MVSVPPVLIRRLKSHFLTLPCGVDLILGLNGYIWISKHVKETEEGDEGFDAEAVYSNRNDVSPELYLFQNTTNVALQDIDGATRSAISRVGNIISILAAHFVALTDAILLEAYEWAVEQGEVKDLLQQDVGEALVAAISAPR